MSVPKLPINILFVTIVSVCALCGHAVVLSLSEGDDSVRLGLGLQTLTLFVFLVWCFRTSRTYLSAPAVLATTIYMWHSTFLVGHFFHLAPIFEFPGSAFTYGRAYVPKATALVSFCLACTIIGSIIAYHQQRRYRQRSRSENPSLTLGQEGGRLSWVLMALLSIILVIYIMFEGRYTFGREYMAAYYEASHTLLYRLFHSTQFFWTSAILLAIASNRSSTRRRLVAILLWIGVVILLMAMLGSRSVPFVCLCSVVIAIDYFIKPLPLWSIILFLFGLSAASFIIDQSRGTGLGLHVFAFSETGKDLNLWHLFYQNGLDIRTVLRTMEFIGDSQPFYGQSIVESIIQLVPQQILEPLGLDPHFIVPSVWVINNSGDIGLFNGIGFSVVAEVYYNFKMFGALIFLFIGWYVASTYYNGLLFRNMFSLLKSMVIVAILTLHMRSDSGVYLRIIVLSVLTIKVLEVRRIRQLRRSRNRNQAITRRPDLSAVKQFDPAHVSAEQTLM